MHGHLLSPPIIDRARPISSMTTVHSFDVDQARDV
jgi:hypothetical protein